MPSTAICFALAVGAFVVAYLGAWLIRRIAVRAQLMDLPGHRRSHATATPRGGGIGIALVIVVSPWIAYGLELLGFSVTAGVSGGAFLIALCGAWDDRFALGPAAKLGLQAVSVVWLLLWLAMDPVLQQAGPLSWGWPGYLFAAVAILWMTNLFNFMDGIDALAATQALLTVSVIGLLFVSLGNPAWALMCLLVAAAVLGFTPQNWPPARVFMGDVSSLSLGWISAVYALVATSHSISVLPFILLFGLFFFDATITLINRMIGGRRWYTAHREHAYQALVRSGMSHLQVALLGLACNLVIFLPAAWLAWKQPDWAWLVLVLTGMISLLFWVLARQRFKAASGRTKADLSRRED